MNATSTFNIRGLTPLKLAEVLWNCDPLCRNRNWLAINAVAKENPSGMFATRVREKIEEAKCIIGLLAAEGLVQ